MKYEDIKPGMKFSFEAEVLDSTQNDRDSMEVGSLGTGRSMFIETLLILDALNKPAIDKTRKFRKGDIVRCAPTGRGYGALGVCNHVEYILARNENGGDCAFLDEDHNEQIIKFFDLELVKSIEEIEAEKPYSIKESSDQYTVIKNSGKVIAIFIRYSEGDENKELKLAQSLCDELNNIFRARK